MDFKLSIDKYKVLYYHFLDSFINQDVGDNTDNIISFITSNCILSSNIYIIKQINIDTFQYTNMNKQFDVGNFNINFNKIICTKIDVNLYKKIFKYCIFQIDNDDHAISILIF
jgi:hypothetical protein